VFQWSLEAVTEEDAVGAAATAAGGDAATAAGGDAATAAVGDAQLLLMVMQQPAVECSRRQSCWRLSNSCWWLLKEEMLLVPRPPLLAAPGGDAVGIAATALSSYSRMTCCWYRNNGCCWLPTTAAVSYSWVSWC